MSQTNHENELSFYIKKKYDCIHNYYLYIFSTSVPVWKKSRKEKDRKGDRHK